jgi:hypothetical protein
MGYIFFYKKAISVITTVISRGIKSLTPMFDLSKLCNLMQPYDQTIMQLYCLQSVNCNNIH